MNPPSRAHPPVPISQASGPLCDNCRLPPRSHLLRCRPLVGRPLAGCATPPSDPAERAVFEQNNDPLEPLNRQTLELNLFVDRILLKPVTQGLHRHRARGGAGRVEARPRQHEGAGRRHQQRAARGARVAPEPRSAASPSTRTIGIGGFFDVAGKWGLDKADRRFRPDAVRLGPAGRPYLIAPILGPSNPRDLIGMGTDAYIDPFSYLATAKDLDQIQITRFVLDGIDQRARAIDILDDLQKNSLDFYAQLRSLSAAAPRRRIAPRGSARTRPELLPGSRQASPPHRPAAPQPSPSKGRRTGRRRGKRTAAWLTPPVARRCAVRSSGRAPRPRRAAAPRRIPTRRVASSLTVPLR